MPPQPPDARTTPATPNDALREVEAGVRSVEQLPSFDKASVERLLGVSLKHIDAAPSDLPHYEAALSSGPFARVELHEPAATQIRFWLVSLDARSELALTTPDFMQNGVLSTSTPMQIEPDVPPNGVVTFEVPGPPGQRRIYEFDGVNHRFRGVAIHRGDSVR